MLDWGINNNLFDTMDDNTKKREPLTKQKSVGATQTATQSKVMRIVCLSDMHSLPYDAVIPDGDVLVVAGDICLRGHPNELRRFNDFLGDLPHPNKLFIAGNHDWPMYHGTPKQVQAVVSNAIYLQDSGVDIDGVRFWGSPWQPEFMGWAFNLPRGQALADKWALIPDDTDVLVTHGPPFGILDRVIEGEHVGCEDLLAAVQRIKPKVHVFGHIHEAYGMVKQDNTVFINASVCTVRYWPNNLPIVVELNLPKDNR